MLGTPPPGAPAPVSRPAAPPDPRPALQVLDTGHTQAVGPDPARRSAPGPRLVPRGPFTPRAVLRPDPADPARESWPTPPPPRELRRGRPRRARERITRDPCSRSAECLRPPSPASSPPSSTGGPRGTCRLGWASALAGGASALGTSGSPRSWPKGCPSTPRGVAAGVLPARCRRHAGSRLGGIRPLVDPAPVAGDPSRLAAAGSPRGSVSTPARWLPCSGAAAGSARALRGAGSRFRVTQPDRDAGVRTDDGRRFRRASTSACRDR